MHTKEHSYVLLYGYTSSTESTSGAAYDSLRAQMPSLKALARTLDQIIPSHPVISARWSASYDLLRAAAWWSQRNPPGAHLGRVPPLKNCEEAILVSE